MSLNLSRNAVAMERALGFLADAEGSIEDCSSCLARDVLVSEAQALNTIEVLWTLEMPCMP